MCLYVRDRERECMCAQLCVHLQQKTPHAGRGMKVHPCVGASGRGREYEQEFLNDPTMFLYKWQTWTMLLNVHFSH